MLAIINNQLGNQMFTYASIKSVALSNGYSFHYTLNDTYLTNSKDEKYGNTIFGIFKNTQSEYIHIKDNSKTDAVIYKEPLARDYNYQKDVYSLPDKSIVSGLFQSPKYFRNKRSIRQWFEFPNDILYSSHNYMNKIRKENSDSVIVCLHFRQGADYRKMGYAISLSYYMHAIRQVINDLHDNCVFLVFGDCIPNKLNGLMKGQKYYIHRGSLAEDLCLMSLCDAFIISNSTFSWWGAYLSDSKKVYRPSKYYTFGRSVAPMDIYPTDWISVKANRSLESSLCGSFVSFTNSTRVLLKNRFPKAYECIISKYYKAVKLNRTDKR